MVVAIPTTCNLLPTAYALPPSITVTSVNPPVASTVTFAVAWNPVVEVPIPTSFAL